MMHHMTRAADPQPVFPLDKADLCVKCGLCLPDCPSYTQTRHEADSPRGRIALLQGLARNLIPDSPSLQAHLDGCLNCRRCEQVCPAKVPYGELIDAGRALQHARGRAASGLSLLLQKLLPQAPWRRLLRHALRLLQHLGLRRLPPALAGHWPSLIPPAEPALSPAGAYRAPAKALRVGLFRGCVNDIAEPQTLARLDVLLQGVGLQVQSVATQTCCGALAQHAGLQNALKPLLQQNLDAFADCDVITYAGSGCGATLLDYRRLDAGPAAQAFSARVMDPHRLLLQHWPDALALKPCKLRAAVHLPCTQENVCGGSEALLALLRKIPGLELLPLADQPRCCGAAGTHFLSEPEAADRLLAPRLDELSRLKPDLLLSSNIGCSLHYAAGLQRRGLTVPVLHPLALLAQQWPDA